MAHICVGIDIGSYSVKVAEVEFSSKKLKLIRLEEHLLSQNPNHDRRIELIDLFLRLSSHYKEEVQFIVGVPQKSISLRRCHFPFRERHKILKGIVFELEEEIPFAPEDTIFDVKVLEYNETQTEVLAIVCPKSYVLDLLEMCQDGSIQPSIVSVEGLATVNVLGGEIDSIRTIGLGESESFSGEAEQQESEKHPTHVILQMGHQSSLLMIFKNQTLFDIRNLDFGGQNVAEAIANAYQIHPMEGARELREKSYVLINEEGVTKEQVHFSNIVKQSFDDFSTQVRLTLLKEQTKSNLQYTQVLMTGGLSQIKNIGPYLTQRLGVPTNRMTSPPAGLPLTMDHSSVIWGSTAVGLAIEGFKKPKDPATNLLKGELAQKNDGFQLFLEEWSYTLRMFSIFFVLFFVFSVMRYQFTGDINDQAQSQVKKQVKTVTKKKGRQASEKNIKKWIKKQKTLTDSLDFIRDFQKVPSAMDLLKKVSEMVPKKSIGALNVTNIKIEHTTITIEGKVSTKNYLTSLVTHLKKISKDKKIKELKPSSSSSGGQIAFSYQFQIDS